MPKHFFENIGKDHISPSFLYISTRNGSFAARGRRQPFTLDQSCSAVKFLGKGERLRFYSSTFPLRLPFSSSFYGSKKVKIASQASFYSKVKPAGSIRWLAPQG
ncbi:hypothetical protein ABEW34_22400 [Paenibacillus algorifonticola]|uniref:hypothetical protein n=1 Tax=Paenibacillus algorifonticola TaxID=684063 RepID=UPI003D2DD149